MFNKILFATDNTAHSERALPRLIDMAKSNNSEVIVLNAYYIPEYLKPKNISAYYIDTDKMEQNLIEHGNKVIKEVREKLEEENIKVTTFVENGPAGKVIVDKALSENCDLILVGTRGLGNIKNPIISSVSNFVIHNAHCSVLLIQ